MICGIYTITHIATGRIYVGKSKNIKQRWSSHRWMFKKDVCHKDCNRYLYNAVKKYGVDGFKFDVVEIVPRCDKLLSEKELWWMLELNSLTEGFNLRKDSSSGMEVHYKTRQLQSANQKGIGNANYGNNWSDEQKLRMSLIAKERHASGEFYGDEFKKKLSIAAKRVWADLDKRKVMGSKVRIAMRKFKFNQFTREGVYIKTWLSVDDIIAANPDYKWQNIYSVCNGYKPTYMNYIWKKELL